MSRFLRYSVLLILLCVTVVAHAGPVEDYRAARNSYQQLLTSPSKQQYRHHWDKVFSKLQRYVERYPSHNKAPSAYYLLGQSYEKLYEISRAKKDARTAVDYYQRLARRYPSSSLADDALLYSARLQCTSLGEDQGARTDCEAIMLRYNKGDMRSEAKSLLQRLPKAAAIKKPADISRTTARSTVQAPARFAGIRVDKIRHSTDNDHTRVVIELNQLPTYTVNTLPSSQKNNTSARLYVDLYQTKINKSLPITQKPPQGIVRKIRIGVNSKTTRVVCDLEKLTRYKVVTLDNPPRIVIDFARHQGAVLRSLIR